MTEIKHSLKLKLEKATGMQWQQQDNEFISASLPFNTDNIRQLAVLTVGLNSILTSMESNTKKSDGYPERGHRVYPVSIKSEPEKTRSRQTRIAVHNDDVDRLCSDIGTSEYAAALLGKLRDFISDPKEKGYLRGM